MFLPLHGPQSGYRVPRSRVQPRRWLWLLTLPLLMLPSLRRWHRR